MKADRVSGAAMVLLGVGAAAGAVLGPLVLGVIKFRVGHNAETQMIGGEIVSLAAVAPVAVVSGVLWLRGHKLAPLLAIAPAAYAVYTYVQFVLGAEYIRYEGNNERAFPLYLALILLGGLMTARSWQALDARWLPEPGGLRRVLAGLLMFVAVAFAATWLKQVAAVMGGTLTAEYEEQPVLFWLVRLMDLGLLLPLLFATGVGLLRGAAWAVKAGYAFAGFGTLMAASITGMGIAMFARDDPSASIGLAAVAGIVAAGLGAVWARLIWRGRDGNAGGEPPRIRTLHPAGR